MSNYFNYGLEENLPSIENIEEVRAYVTTDEHSLYFDINGKRIKISDIFEVDTVQGLQSISTKNFCYVKENHSLYKYDGSQWNAITGQGVSDYNELTNKPKINGVELQGEITLSDLGLESNETLEKILSGEITVPNAESAVASFTAASATNATLVSGKDLAYLLNYENFTNTPTIDTTINASSHNAIANSAVAKVQQSCTENSEKIKELEKNNIFPLTYSYSNSAHTLTKSKNINFPQYQNVCFMPTTAYTAGDSLTIDGTSYTLKMQDGSALKSGLWAASTLVTATLDTYNHTINFKNGGGISLSQLSNQASAAQILQGRAVYDHEGNVIAGTMTNKTSPTNFSATPSVYNSNARMKIPESGYYSSNNYLQTTKKNMANIILTGGVGTVASSSKIIKDYYAWDKDGNLLQGSYSPPNLIYGTFTMPTYDTLTASVAVTINCPFQPKKIFIQDIGISKELHFLMYSDFERNIWHIGIDGVPQTIANPNDARGVSWGGHYVIERTSSNFTFNFYPIGNCLITQWNANMIVVSGHLMEYIAIG